jgi:adenylate cyclase
MKQFRRRFVTILSADISGFCRMMGSDDEPTLATLLTYRHLMERIVVRGGGRMFGVAGDSWMAEFASPVEVVRCAVVCQRSVEDRNSELPERQRIRFRLGVHMGDVMVDGEGLYGDDVNIAARLQQICRPGHLVLSDAVFRHIVGKVNLRFNALGPQRLKNIAVAVSAFSAEVITPSDESPADDLVSAVDVSQPVPGFDGRPAIAVLAFNTLGNSTGSEYFGEGLAEDLITGLSNVRWFPVISRSSSFIFKNQALDSRSIGRALGARYLVSGSVRLSEKDLRLVVHLIDAENDLNLWSQKYQLDFSKLFDVQDEIAASIVSVLDSEIERAEQTRSRTRAAEDLDTWELVRRGIWHLYKFTKEDAAAARLIFEEALKRDPGSAEARVQLAWWYFWDVWAKRGDLSILRIARQLGREATLIDPRDARAHSIVGVALMMMGEAERSRPHYLEAIRLNPSLASAHAPLGSSYILAGEAEKGIAPLLLSIRLNPHDLYGFHYLGELAIAYHLQGQWAKACEFAERSLQFRANYWYARAVLIASLARSGWVEKASELAAEPASRFSREQINWLPFADKKWNDYLLDGLRLGGCRLS